MSKREWTALFENMLECIRKVERYTDTLDFGTFAERPMVIDAVVRNLEITGEAANQLPNHGAL